MVERRIELDRRYTRKKKMKKLKAKLQGATGEVREKLLYKIKRLSPFWLEPGTAPVQTAAPRAESTGGSSSSGPKRKPAAKPKGDKK
jgi:hypothetical protein